MLSLAFNVIRDPSASLFPGGKLFADGPIERITRMSAIAALAVSSKAAAIRWRGFVLFRTQDKVTSRTSLADTIHEIVQRRILAPGGQRFELGKSG